MERFTTNSENLKARDEVVGGDAGNHFDKLYDQEEDAAGQKIDEANGKKIDNSPITTGNDEHLSIIKIKDRRVSDALGALPKENDEAAKWLAEHDKKNKAA